MCSPISPYSIFAQVRGFSGPDSPIGVDESFFLTLKLALKTFQQEEHSEARWCYTVGILLENRESSKSQSALKKAFDYYLKAADDQFPPACAKIGFMHENGRGTSKNQKTALEYYERAFFKLGFFPVVPRMVKLAQLYLGSPAIVLEYHRKVAARGDSTLCNMMGSKYFYGDGFKKNFRIAVCYFERAAKQKDAVALNFLGVMYRKGLGVVVDLGKSFNYFSEAAQQNLPDAQYNLGQVYRLGLGIPINLILARQWIELSAKAKAPVPKAFLILAKLHRAAIMPDADPILAIEFFRRAAMLEIESAKNGLSQLGF